MLFVSLALVADTAAADPLPPGAVLGRFPKVEVGLLGGFGMTPIPYVSGTGTEDTYDNLTGVVGPSVQLHLDAKRFLVNVEGLYNVAQSEVGLLARGQVVFGSGLGLRTRHNVLKSMSTTNGVTTTEHYVNKHVPMLIGLSAGATVATLGETRLERGMMPTGRPSALVSMIDAGFTLQSPQIQLTAAPLVEMGTGSFGFHWSFGMSFPVGNKSLFFRTTGHHVFGGDPQDLTGRRMQALVLCTIGLGGGYGTK